MVEHNIGIRERMKDKINKLINEKKIIAILRKVPMDAFADTVKALYEGGIRMMEVTFDQSGEMFEETTCDQIRYIKDNFPQISPGAGTVMTVEQVKKAIDAGAQYIISPNVNENVIKETLKLGAVSMPGAFTPSEAANACAWGADYVKIFPVGNMGAGYVKDVSAPLSNVRFLAVGGINDKNMKSFLDAGCVGVGIGSCLVNKKMIKERRFDELKELAKKYVEAAK